MRMKEGGWEQQCRSTWIKVHVLLVFMDQSCCSSRWTDKGNGVMPTLFVSTLLTWSQSVAAQSFKIHCPHTGVTQMPQLIANNMINIFYSTTKALIITMCNAEVGNCIYRSQNHRHSPVRHHTSRMYTITKLNWYTSQIDRGENTPGKSINRNRGKHARQIDREGSTHQNVFYHAK